MVNAQNPWGLTALHISAMMGHLDVLGFLISHGGDVHLGTDEGQNVLQYLCFYNAADITRPFLEECGLYEPSMEESEFDFNEMRRVFRGVR